jgi:hypothetical protein
MFKHHESEWVIIRKETKDLFGMESLFPPKYVSNTKAVYNFIWRSSECFGDNNILLQRRRIRRFIWELPLFFVVVILATLIFTITSIIK